jgi:multiple sugar transport system permease protein
LIVSFGEVSLLGGQSKFAGLSQYGRIFSDARFWGALLTTLEIAIPSLLLEISLGIAIATLLNKKWKVFQVTRPLTFLPMMITPVVVGLMWAVMLNPDFGIVNYLLSLVGISPVLWLADAFYSKLALIITNVWEWTPFSILIILAGLQGLPEEPFKAARVDGASSWQIFRRLTLPLLKPVIVVVILIRTIWLLQLFDIVMVITAGGPGSSTETISMYIYKQGFHFFDLSYASALSLLYLVFISGVCTLILRWARVNR